MTRKILISSVVLSIGILLAAASMARANMITNGGFESPSTANNDFSAPTGWTVQNGLNDAMWICNMNGVWNAGRLGVAPSSPTGEVQAYYVQQYAQFYQTLSTAVQPNTVYTLTSDVGAVKLGVPYEFMAPTLTLGTGNVFGQNLLTLVSSSTPAPSPSSSAGDWKTWSYTFQTGATVPTANLRVDIYMPGYTEYRLAGLDNVSLTSSPIPEPSTIVLLASGLIGLLAYAWRKRR
jgi:hypothetical protein